MAAKARKITPDRGVMFVEEIAPPLVAERGRPLGGADDVGEEHRGENAIDCDRGPRTGQKLLVRIRDFVGALTDVEKVVYPRKLDEAGARNMRRRVASALHADGLSCPVNHEGRYPYGRKDATYFDLAVHAHESYHGGGAGAEAFVASPPALEGRVICA
jgi:hypothetical protein